MAKNQESRRERIEFAREQRRTANEFAHIAWQLVRGRQILNAKFRREHPIGPYTVDFVCLELKLVIEIDGEGHWTEEGLRHDARRDAYLRRLGFEVMRFPGFRLLENAFDVQSEIEKVVERIKVGSIS
jgi:very-short-patch-repair endonuclease